MPLTGTADPVVIPLIPMRDSGDCAVCCLSMLLEKPYKAILDACPRKYKTTEQGLSYRQILGVARRLKIPLHWTLGSPDDETLGLVIVTDPESSDAHAVLYVHGVVYNPASNELWTDLDVYVQRKPWAILGYFWREEQ